VTLPTSYTEKTLAEYMHVEVGKLASILGYAVGVSDAGSYQEAVNNAIARCGVTLIADMTDIPRARATARAEVWKKACNDLAAFYGFSSDGARFDRDQMFAQANVNRDRAEDDLYAFECVIEVSRRVPVNDPYRYTPEEDRTL